MQKVGTIDDICTKVARALLFLSRACTICAMHIIGGPACAALRGSLQRISRAPVYRTALAAAVSSSATLTLYAVDIHAERRLWCALA